MATVLEGKLIGTGLKIGIVATRWNDFMGTRMLDGARGALLQHGVADDDITIVTVPGCYEVPLVAKVLAESGDYDALVCLEDGLEFQSLKRHLRVKYNLTPDAYRQKWGLPRDYPMVAPDYARRRSALAKRSGLGKSAP